MVQSLEISASNYKVAWNLLKDRYDNKRIIVKNHVRAIREIPTINKESYADLRKLLDTLQIHMRALKALERPVDSWDDLLIDLVTCKIDSSTNKEWESSLTTADPPKMDDMLKFLNRRCQILEALPRKGREAVSTPLPKSHGKATANNGSKNNKLHKMWQKPLFKRVRFVFEIKHR